MLAIPKSVSEYNITSDIQRKFCVKRVPAGIEGPDGSIEGGFLKGDVILLTGNTGSGRTISSAEFICNGATEYQEKGVYATFKEDEKTLKRNIAKFGFDPEKLEHERASRKNGFSINARGQE